MRYKFLLAMVILIVSSVLITGYVIYYRDLRKLDYSCSAHLDQVDSLNLLHMSTVAIFYFRPDGKAMVTFDGTVRKNGLPYRLQRTFSFNYEYYSRNIYMIRNVITTPTQKDNLPEKFFERNFFSDNAISINSIDGIPKAILIGSLASPAFMCAVD